MSTKADNYACTLDEVYSTFTEIYSKFAKQFIQIVGPKTFNTMSTKPDNYAICTLVDPCSPWQ